MSVEGWVLESDAFFLEAPGLRRSLPRVLDMRCLAGGDGSSPDVRWSEPPPGTLSLALLLERVEPSFCQWLIYNIPPELRHLPPGIPPQESLPNGICQGVHSGGRLGYLPPSREVGRGQSGGRTSVFKAGASDPLFRLRLTALRCEPSLPARMTREAYLAAIEGKGLGETELWVRLPPSDLSVRPKGRVA